MEYVWKKEYETGHPVVDFQHRQVHNAFKCLLEGCSAGMDTDQAETTLDFLAEYCGRHLRDMNDEKTRLHSQYPFQLNNDYLHTILVRYVNELRDELKKEGCTPAFREKLCHYLREMTEKYTEHISREKTAGIAEHANWSRLPPETKLDILQTIGAASRLNVSQNAPLIIAATERLVQLVVCHSR